MTLPSDAVKKARDSFLLSVKDPQVDASLLMEILEKTERQTPGIFESLQPDSETLTNDQIDWSANHFSRHFWLAKKNFARERIEHLIKVKDYLCKQDVKGFTPASKSSPPPQLESNYNVNSIFIPSENLRNFVDEGDLLTIRTALRMELYDNRISTVDLKAAMAWTKSMVPGLFEDLLEGSFARGLDTNCEHWTSEYFENQIVYLKTNFAEERFLHLIEVRERLRQKKTEGFVALSAKTRSAPLSPASTCTHSQSENHQRQGADNMHSGSELNPIFKTAMLIGGAFAALVVLLITLTK